MKSHHLVCAGGGLIESEPDLGAWVSPVKGSMGTGSKMHLTGMDERCYEPLIIISLLLLFHYYYHFITNLNYRSPRKCRSLHSLHLACGSGCQWNLSGTARCDLRLFLAFSGYRVAAQPCEFPKMGPGGIGVRFPQTPDRVLQVRQTHSFFLYITWFPHLLIEENNCSVIWCFLTV